MSIKNQFNKVAKYSPTTFNNNSQSNLSINSYIAASQGDGEGTGTLARAHQLAKAQESAKAEGDYYNIRLLFAFCDMKFNFPDSLYVTRSKIDKLIQTAIWKAACKSL